MIKFLKKDRGASIATDKTPTGKAKSTDELIEEIHETFYTEVDRLLASAKIAHSLYFPLPSGAGDIFTHPCCES